MKVCGFTIVRNAEKYDYPIVESIKSVLDICDKFIVLVGNSDDNTIELLKSINSEKIELVNSVWDDSLRTGGKVLAVETNKAFDLISSEFDWCFYLQADELVHEKYHLSILESMKKYKDDKRVEGLLFHYLHFYGTYDFVGDSRRWYRNEIRIIRNDKSIRSFRDAQGFRKNDNLLKVKEIDAFIYHYGWVKPPEKQQAKQKDFNKLWHDDNWVEKNVANTDLFDYSEFDSLERFQGTHPKVMEQRIKSHNIELVQDPHKKKFKSLLKYLLFIIEKKTNFRIGEYKNYKKI